MRVFQLISSFILLVSTSAIAQTESFTCQLKDFVILAMEDGKSTRYSGFTDSYDVGDTFRIEMTIDEAEAIPTVEIDVVFDDESLALTLPLDIKYQPLDAGDAVHIGDPKFGYGIGMDFFRISGLFQEFKIWRYYKGDWQGLWTGSDNGNNSYSFYVGTLNCMGASQSIDPIYSKIFSLSDIELLN